MHTSTYSLNTFRGIFAGEGRASVDVIRVPPVDTPCKIFSFTSEETIIKHPS